MHTLQDLKASLILERGPRGHVGVDRIDLLEAISREGSIGAAAKSLGLSYKGGWDAVQALNNLFDRPLVIARAGGRDGGQATLTEAGGALIGAFRSVENELAQVLAGFQSQIGRHADAFPKNLLWSLSMKTSARNALRGIVEDVIDGAVNAEVIIDVGGGAKMVSIVTRHSVQDLGLTPGSAVIALVKSSFVILAKGASPPKTSARNSLAGTIVRIDEGAVNSEIALEISPGKILTATITRRSLDEMELEVGSPATALIKASHVILAVE